MKNLSTIAVMALALFISNGLFAQGKSGGRGKAHVNRPVAPAGINTREQARIKGSVNANANANEIAKSKANSNSVLNDDQATAIPRGKKHHRNRRHHKS